MSLVTTPTSSAPASAAQSAATSVLLPVPTGPAIPIRSARSAGKEPPRVVSMPLGPQVEQRGGGGRQLAGCRRLAGERLDRRRRGRDPGGGVGGVDGEQLRRGGGDGGRVLVERQARDLDRR